MTITAEQAVDLARSFHSACVQVGLYRFENYSTMSKAEREAIERSQWDLLNASMDMTTRAVGLRLDEIGQSVVGLNTAVKRATTAIKTIESVKKAINIAAVVVDLSLAIMSKNPQGVLQSVSKLAKLLGDDVG